MRNPLGAPGASDRFNRLFSCVYSVCFLGDRVASRIASWDRESDRGLTPLSTGPPGRESIWQDRLRASLIDGSHQLLLRFCCASSTLRRE